MRIIAGQWRRRLLTAPEGNTTRPTADRARETLFSMLTSRLGSFEDLTVLDLFAGSGALAMESLSRGAARAFLVERDSEARRAIAANIRTFGANARLIGTDATALPAPTAGPAHLIFLDPPYNSELWQPALASAGASGWAGPGTIASIETARTEQPAPPGWDLLATRIVGKARLTLVRVGDATAPHHHAG